MEIPYLLHFTAKNEKEAREAQDLKRYSLVSTESGEELEGQQSAFAIIKPIVKLEKSGISGKPPAIDAEHDCSVNEDALQLPMDLTRPIENSAPSSPPRKKHKKSLMFKEL